MIINRRKAFLFQLLAHVLQGFAVSASGELKGARNSTFHLACLVFLVTNRGSNAEREPEAA